jgi:hypothetical protein
MMLFRKWRYFSQRLILYLAIAALLASISTILHRVDYDNNTSDFYTRFCAMGGFLEQVTSWIFLNANSTITVHLFLKVTTKLRTKRFELLYVFFIFVFPLTFNWIPFIHSAYGRSGAWCWIRSDDPATCEKFALGQYMIFFLWYIPLYTTLLTLIGLYIVILFRLHRASKEWSGNQSEEAEEIWRRSKRDILPLMAYPAIFFTLSFPPLINRIHGWANPGSPELVLWYISSVSFPLQGGLIAVAYGLDPGTRKRLRWNHVKAALLEYIGKKERTVSAMEYPAEHVTGGSLEYRQYIEEEKSPRHNQRTP